jgi:tryptophan synthase alpha chain
MNRINQLFQQRTHNILSIYFTAGYPALEDTLPILQSLQEAGVDLVEVGMPFSDPLADGPVIQESSTQAIATGMTIAKLMEQLQDLRPQISMPVVLMGYLNPVLQYGMEAFCEKCAQVGVDGVILPDLPMDEFERDYKATFEKYGLHFILLVTPETSETRIRELDQVSGGFIYAVSSSSTTGKDKDIGDQQAYFKKLQALELRNPVLVGFGIKDKATFEAACAHTRGAIIGTAFVKTLGSSPNIQSAIASFIKSVR